MERNKDRECQAVADLTGSVRQARVSQFPVGGRVVGRVHLACGSVLIRDLRVTRKVPVRGRNHLAT